MGAPRTDVPKTAGNRSLSSRRPRTGNRRALEPTMRSSNLDFEMGSAPGRSNHAIFCQQPPYAARVRCHQRGQTVPLCAL